MPGRSGRTPEEVRRDIEAEREQLAAAVDELREEVGEVTDLTGKIRGKLPVVAVGALGAGFVLAGGIGATARLLMRRSGEGVLRQAGAAGEREHECGGGGEQGEGQATRHEWFLPFERGFRSPYDVK